MMPPQFLLISVRLTDWISVSEHRTLVSDPVELAARMIVARTSGQIDTHWEDCHLYHLPCFAVFVLDQMGAHE